MSCATIAAKPTTTIGDTRPVIRSPRPSAAIAMSSGPVTALVQTGVMSAAIRIPTTAAFVPDSARRKPADPRSWSQNGSAPKISRNEGRKIATSAIVAPASPLGGGAETVPR